MIRWTPAILLAAGVTFVGCQTEPAGPEVGSAEWYWEAARHNHAMGDYERAQEHLERLASTYSGWRDRAEPWRAALTGGLARGYLELTDTFGLCASMNAKLAAELQNPIQEWRRNARRHALNFSDAVAAIGNTLQDHEALLLDFSFPAGRPAKSPLMENIESGMTPRPDQIAGCEEEALGRGVVLQTSMMAGVGRDAPQAQKLFESPPVEVPANKMLCSLADSLLELAAIFDARHVNEADKEAYMLDLAVKTLQSPLSCADAEIRKTAEEIRNKALAKSKAAS
jgi:hypothetical protein